MLRLLLLAAGALVAQSLERDLQPIFRKHCYGCHAASVKMGSLDVETYDGLMRGGNQGTILVPGKPAESRLYLTLAGKLDPAMPMGGDRLPAADLETIRKWIEAGARPDPTALAWRGGVIAVGWGGEVRILSEKGAILRRFPAQVGTVRTVSLSADGKLVAAAGPHVLRVFDTVTGREVMSADLDSPVQAAVSPDGSRRAVLLPDGSVKIEEIQ